MAGHQRHAQTCRYRICLCHRGMLQRYLVRVHTHVCVLAYDTAQALRAIVGSFKEALSTGAV